MCIKALIAAILHLDIGVDSVNQELRLPIDQLNRSKTIINNWIQKRSSAKHELQCFLEHLSFACKW